MVDLDADESDHFQITGSNEIRVRGQMGGVWATYELRIEIE